MSELAKTFGRTQERELLAMLLEEMRHLRVTQTDLMDRVAAGILNNVLLSELWTFDSTGLYTRSFNVAAGSAVVVNLSETNDITVTSSGQQSSAPTQGPGVQKIAAGTFLTLPLASRDITCYGTSGDQINVQVFTGLQAFSGGAVR